ncbi:MAG: PdxA family protein [Pseudobdellovibrionaceae bacterium]
MKPISKLTQNNFFAITTGDANGIGLEVTAKALLDLQNQNSAVLKQNLFFVFCSKFSNLNKRCLSSAKFYFGLMNKKFSLIEISSCDFKQIALVSNASHARKLTAIENLLKNLKNTPSRKPLVIIVKNSSSPPQWVVDACEGCLQHFFDGMITAPLSKPLIKESGFGEVGHTEILKTVCERKTQNKYSPFMAFSGAYFNVAIATGHIPISGVAKSLTPEKLDLLYREIKKLNKKCKDSRPIGILGLNPHAGDGGIIGDEEVRWLNDFCRMKNRSLPLVPDAAFLPHQRNRFSFLICLYHDQGLIPFKAIHGTHGAHFTLGLPINRTSVDHGTAFDLFGKDSADSSSMVLAIKSAITMV